MKEKKTLIDICCEASQGKIQVYPGVTSFCLDESLKLAQYAPDSIRHMNALMEIDEIDALQWTSGDHGPDGTLEEWDIIYDKARTAGKSIWVKVYSGQFEDWVRNADRLVKRYGSHSLFFHFPEMSTSQAETLLEYAEKNWTDIEGTFSAK